MLAQPRLFLVESGSTRGQGGLTPLGLGLSLLDRRSARVEGLLLGTQDLAAFGHLLELSFIALFCRFGCGDLLPVPRLVRPRPCGR